MTKNDQKWPIFNLFNFSQKPTKNDQNIDSLLNRPKWTPFLSILTPKIGRVPIYKKKRARKTHFFLEPQAAKNPKKAISLVKQHFWRYLPIPPSTFLFFSTLFFAQSPSPVVKGVKKGPKLTLTDQNWPKVDQKLTKNRPKSTYFWPKLNKMMIFITFKNWSKYRNFDDFTSKITIFQRFMLFYENMRSYEKCKKRLIWYDFLFMSIPAGKT